MKTTELKIIFEMKFYWMGLTVNWTLQKTNNPPQKKQNQYTCKQVNRNYPN